jgi:riboflavin biosynthesis pyrimidine reductase
MRIIANLVIGSDGATVLEGSSKALSSELDRSRFHALREKSSTILIGGNTARNEPYSKTPVPLVIVSASNQIPKGVRNNPLAHIWNISPLEAIMRIGDEFEVFGSEILVEGGAQLLQELLDGDVIDELFITQTQQIGGTDAINLKSLTSGFHEKSCEEISGDKFWHFVRER